MVRFEVSLAAVVFSFLSALPSHGYCTENGAESGLQENGTEAGLDSASEASVSNGNEADTHQQSMASSEANSENGAVFFVFTTPKNIPLLPSGLPPTSSVPITPPSNYVTSPSAPSSYVISGNPSSSTSSAKPALGPTVKVWTAKGYNSSRRGNEMLASKSTPRETKQEPVEQIAAPVQSPYYQMSSSDDSPVPAWAGYGAWPSADAFNHQ